METTFNWFGYGFFIDRLDIWAAVIAAVLVAALVVFSQYTKQGRAMRAVADDHQAALSVGISLRFIWVMVWSIAGFVALVAGIMWGSKSGVQFSLSLIALKALPVLILGGFTSIPGAIVGGLLIGVGEKLFDFFMQPIIGGATENWFAYMLALAFLLFRPQGLFGEKIIAKVFFLFSGLLALGAVLSGIEAMSIPGYRRQADILQAAAWMRAGALLGGALSAAFAGYVCQKLDEITQLLRGYSASNPTINPEKQVASPNYASRSDDSIFTDGRKEDFN